MTETTEQQILSKLEDIDKKVTVIEAQRGTCLKRLDQLDHIVSGNGSDGLTTRVAMNERSIDAVAVTIRDESRNPKLSVKQWAAIVGVLGATGFLSSAAGKFTPAATPQPPAVEQPAENPE